MPQEYSPEVVGVTPVYTNLDDEFERLKDEALEQELQEIENPPMREVDRWEQQKIKQENLPPVPVFGYEKEFIPNSTRSDDLITPFDIKTFGQHRHSKTLHQNLSVPSMAQSYSLCIEYAKRWFMNLWNGKHPFKSVYVDGKNVFDDYRRLTAVELLKREKPALAVIPSFDWSFNNEGVDIYQFGTKLYRSMGLYQNSFYKDPDHQSYLGMQMETLYMEFTYRVRVETRAQQLDMFKYLQLAGRVGSTTGENVDLDFHIPYDIILALAEDAGFEICSPETDKPTDYPKVKNVKAFLAHLNSHSELPFLYKMRAINGRNEYFIRMQNMYVHTRPTNISGDDGEREGVLNNNFVVEFTTEVRFPAPKFFAYYTDNKKEFTTVYSAWRQPTGIVSAFYTFKGIQVPDKNQYGWDKYLETTYEEDIKNIGEPLDIDLNPLLSEGDLGETIRHCLATGISPSIFVDTVIINGGEYVSGRMDWDTLRWKGDHVARSQNSYIAMYIDLMFINDYIANARTAKDNRLQHTKDPNDPYKDSSPII